MILTADQKVYIVLFLAAAAAFLLIWLLRKFKSARPLKIDELDGHDFEYYCADLLRANGFLDVEVTKGSGDFGADWPGGAGGDHELQH